MLFYAQKGESMYFNELGAMIDCSRNAVLTQSAFCRMVDILAKLGYTNIRLYIEDTYEVEGEPCFGHFRGKYSVEELREMDAYASSRGLKLVPCVQTLAHLNAIFRYADYIRVNDVSDILFVGEERTYVLIENMFRALSKAFTSRTVNIGMDEAFLLGRGKYFNKYGTEKSEVIMRKHLDRVLAIANQYGFTCEMWGDMFVTAAFSETGDAESVRAQVPKNVRLVCWDYYKTDAQAYLDSIEKYVKLTDDFSFAGGAWTWVGFCPSSTYAIEATRAAVTACREKGVREFYTTLWGDNGGECSPFAALPALVCTAEFARGNFDMESIKRKFYEVVGCDYDLFMALELPDKVLFGEGSVDHCNPSKVLFYTDVFMGIYEKRIEGIDSQAYYRAVGEKLKAGECDARWGYLFKQMRAFCEVLEIKFDLCLKTRACYRESRESVARLAQEEYSVLLERLNRFYESFELAWHQEKKPHGFDVQDARIGGLIQRIKHCQKRLLAYANGEVENIPELEEEIFNAFGYEKIDGIVCNNYNLLYTVNVT